MEKIQDNLNLSVDAEFISEEKTDSIFGTTLARAAVVQSLFCLLYTSDAADE